MKRILILFCIILVWGCSSHKAQKAEPEIVKKIEIEQLPSWLYELPADKDLVIGIAARSIYEEDMKDAAKQMATVIHSRNKASYTIVKNAATNSENIIQEGTAQFKLNVSSSPEETQHIYENLNLLDETFYYDYYLAIFSENSDSLTSDKKTKYAANFPSWYQNDGLQIDEDNIRCYASESSSNLISAWQRAAEKARFELANYLEKNVQSELLNEDDRITKKIAIETKLKLEKMKITRCFISSHLSDNLRSYKVYLEMVLQ